VEKCALQPPNHEELKMHKILKQKILMGLVVFSTTQASAEIYGVDFGLVDWENLCPNVQPLSVRGCDTVHPTSALFNNNPSSRIKERNLKCRIEKKNFILYITPKKTRDIKRQWGRCSFRFQAAYKWRVHHPEYFVESVEAWRDRYLKAGVVDKNGHIMARK
jgi:hypothetical protein